MAVCGPFWKRLSGNEDISRRMGRKTWMFEPAWRYALSRVRVIKDMSSCQGSVDRYLFVGGVLGGFLIYGGGWGFFVWLIRSLSIYEIGEKEGEEYLLMCLWFLSS